MILHKTKIVCTLGPACQKESTLEEMIKNGMNIARFNFSHGTFSEKLQTLKTLKKLADKQKRIISTIADLQGPKLRIGEIEGKKQINKNEIYTLSADGDCDIPLQFDLSPYLKKNHRIFINDGLVELTCEKIKDKIIFARAINEGIISSNKGINVPDTLLGNQTLTKKDIQDLGFALENQFDFVALSFVQSKKDIERVKEIIKNANSTTQVIAKIETAKAVGDLEEIIKSADAVLVARGDLAIETSASSVPLIQHNITIIARQQKKPVIIATHMLESMVENPRATRAEVSDVANAVMNQVDAVMLSAESASGKYPQEAVSVMHDIIKSVEENPEFKHYIKIDWTLVPEEELAYNALTSSAASIAYRIKSHLIVVATTTGKNAKVVSSFRPSANIIAAAHDMDVCKKLNLFWGVHPIIVKPANSNTLHFWDQVIFEIKKKDYVPRGSKIVMVGGSKIGIPGATDTIKIVTT